MKLFQAILIKLIENLKDSKSIEQLRNENRERFYQSALRNSEHANNRNLELSKLLFTITSFIFPLSLYPLSNSNLLSSIDYIGKYYLIISWILYACSLFFGIINMINGINFFNKFSEYEIKRSNIFKESLSGLTYGEASKRFNLMIDKASSIENKSRKSTKIWFLFQILTLILGIIALIVVLSRILLK